MLKGILSSVIQFQYDLGFGQFSPLLKGNAPLENTAKESRRCFILATGPSIKSMDLSGLENEFCISVSNFFVHPLFNKIRPSYHIFAGIHPPITNMQVGNWWEDAANAMEGNARTKVFINARDKKIQDEFSAFRNRPVHYYLEGGRYPVNFTKQLPEIQTVVHIAIYLATYLGIKEIYLLGCDHSWILHFGKSSHFYHESQHALTRNNYSEWSEIKDIGEEFRSYAVLWDIYRQIRTQALNKGVKIFNATPSSLLDIFPRRDLNEILNPVSIND
ncbi:MAG: hypothetical protein ACHQET_08360 [Chitinophagales bacterium]